MSSNVRILLRDDVGGVGKKGDIVEVSAGYARNFLVPRGLALRATDGMAAQAAAMQRARDTRDAAARSDAEQVATELVSKVITVSARASEEGSLFGSVTAADLVAAIAEQTGVEIDRHDVEFDEQIKTVGTHHAQVSLHSDVQFPVTVEVSAA